MGSAIQNDLYIRPSSEELACKGMPLLVMVCNDKEKWLPQLRHPLERSADC